MTIARLIRAMAEAGAPPAAIAIAVEAIELRDQAELDRKAKRAEQKRKERSVARLSRDMDATGARLSQETPFPPSPPSPPRDINSTPLSTPSTLSDDGKRAREKLGSRLPEGWAPSQAVRDFGLSNGLAEAEIAQAVDEFRDYWRGVPGARGRKLDWDATLRNRLREIAGRNAVRKGFANERNGKSVQAASKRLHERVVDLLEPCPAPDANSYGDGSSSGAVRVLPQGRGGRP